MGYFIFDLFLNIFPNHFYFLGDEVMRCMRHCVTKMLDRHSLVFNGMMSRLKIDRNSDLKLGFNQLAEELFVERNVTWAKIVALFAFGARLAQHCSRNGLGDLVFDIATLLSQYAVDKLTPFLREHGGWVSFNLKSKNATENTQKTSSLTCVFRGQLSLSVSETFAKYMW